MKKVWLVPWLALLVSTAALAQTTREAPEAVVRHAVETTVAAVQADPKARDGDLQATAQLVRSKFVPATDFRRTTRLAVGAAWKTATPAQQDQLFEQFQNLLVHTYAVQMMQIRDQNVTFRFQPATLQSGGTDAVVRSEMNTNGEGTQVAYRLGKTPTGWRIYDIDMMGAWLIQVYQRQFSEQLQRGGVDGLIKFLAAHNARQEG